MPEKHLRILMVAPTPYFSDRGCHVRIYEEAKALMARGHLVRIVSYGLGRDLEPVPVDRACGLPWYRKRGAGPSWQKPFLDMLLLYKTLAVARRFKPDLIHGHLHEGSLIGWFVARLFGIPLLFDYQGSLSGESLNHGFYQRDSLLHRIFRFVEGRINNLADLTITSSTPGMQELIEQWQLPSERVTVLADGVNLGEPCQYKQAEVRQQLGLPAGFPVIVYLGLLNQYQGIELLLQAAQLMLRQGVRFHLLIMGYPDVPYRSLADTLQINAVVTFTGQIDYRRAPQLLAAGDLAVSPKVSDTEANGKLLNYMACALPVVVFDTPVNRELLGDDGWYAAYGDAEDLARCLTAALADRSSLTERGARLCARAEALFSWQRQAQVLEKIYRQLLAEDP